MRTTIIRETDLTGMTTEEAMAFARRRMDYEFAIEIERTRTAMARDGLDHETIEAWISDRALAFAEERTEHLDGLAAALLKQDGRLN